MVFERTMNLDCRSRMTRMIIVEYKYTQTHSSTSGLDTYYGLYRRVGVQTLHDL